MANNRVDIQIRAVDKGVKNVFDLVAQKLKTGRVALEAYNQALGKTRDVAAGLSNSLKAAFAGVGAGVVVQSLFQAGVQAQNLDRAFTAILGSSAAAKDELAFIRAEADRLGLSFWETADAYKGISAAAAPTELAGEGVRKIFIGVASAASALGMSVDDTSGSLRAIGQMISKDKIQAEELRAQLGDRLFGAFQLMAEAAGVTTAELDKMLVSGEVSIDLLSKFADILTEKYGPAAEKASREAVGTLAKWRTAWMDLKVTLANSGFLENSTSYLTTLTATLKDPAVQKAIGVWAKRFFEVADAIIRTVWEHKGFIAAVMGTVVVGKTLDTLARTILGINAAFKVMMGLSIAGWAGSTIALLKSINLAALSVTGALGAAAGATLALAGGYALGAKIAEWEYLRSVVGANKQALAEIPARFQAISEATGVTIKSFKDLEKAEKDGLIKFDSVTGEWVKGAGKMAAAVKNSAAEQKQATAAALDEMKKKYQAYADEVKRLQDDIAGRERSLADQLREMSRSGMTDIGAWKDRKAQAEEYAAAAKKAAEESRQAFAAGNADVGKTKAEEAVGLFDKAREAAAELNRETKNGEQVIATQQENLKTALSMVEEYGKGAVTVQQELQKSIAQTAQELDKQSGGQLSKELPDIAKQFGEISVQAKDLAESASEFNKAWSNAWDRATLGGKEAIAQLEKELKELTKDRHIKVYVEEVVKKAAGGAIQKLATGGQVLRNMLRGGFFPGFGGGDRRHVVMEDGEYALDKYRVRDAGLRTVRAFHAGRYDIVIAELLKKVGFNAFDLIGRQMGGIINALPAMPAVSSPFMQAGGMVAAPAAAAGGDRETINITLNYSGAGSAVDAGKMADMVMTEIQRRSRRASR